MAFDGTRKALKKLGNQGAVAADPVALVQLIKNESDRSAIVLLATILEDCLKVQIVRKLTGLTPAEIADFFDFNGVAGTFSAKIFLAKALGVISAETRNQIDLLREMRNCSAHASANVSFSTPEIVTAAENFSPKAVQNLLKQFDAAKLRNAFTLVCAGLMAEIGDPGSTDVMPKVISMITDAAKV